ncbi:hypothetical protein MDOR_31010 [Mycolicibacterium doricum]|uniref:Uncharacterized protein n=1 Tax=Mycolicibacterium doricum TaxID=126673 RepID=A0A7I7VWC2_9MYCO|nr:hypothetical protein [Mycolicibacterium doricum]BBZ08932.1 hypothetical protein MDOR_31010 [Mycolicibacterium doricum]
MNGAVDNDWQTVALREHFAQGPIAGVYELDPETTARIHNPPNFGALEAALAAIHQRRIRPDM